MVPLVAAVEEEEPAAPAGELLLPPKALARCAMTFSAAFAAASAFTASAAGTAHFRVSSGWSLSTVFST